jgi:hypothetical protein
MNKPMTMTQKPAPQLLAFWSRGADGRLVMAWVSAQTPQTAPTIRTDRRVLA